MILSQTLLRRSAYIAMAVNGALLLAILVFGIEVYKHYNQSEAIWEGYRDQEVRTSRALSALHKSMGYGGLIHNFKNMVLRRDLDKYQSLIDGDLQEVRRNIAELETLVVTEQERRALGRIEQVIDQYSSSYDTAKRLISQGMRSENIDARVKVSDAEAIVALYSLSTNIDLRMRDAENRAHIESARTNKLLYYGGAILSMIIVITAVLVLGLLRMLVGVNARLVEARNEAELANSAKSRFLSSMSHELRTPMNAILGFAQLLDMNLKDKGTKDNVREIIHAGDHLMHLINELLDLSRIESGKIEMSPEQVSLSSLVDEVLQLTRTMAEDRGVQVIDQVAEQTALQAWADTQRLKQVLLNLVSNAIKYNQEQGLVKLEAELQGDTRLRVSVTDTGSGLTREQVSGLFEPFHRMSENRRVIEGTGLGLVISQELMHLMDGKIGVESEPGQGSTFWIDIPRAL